MQIMQSIGFLGPAFFLTQLSHVRTPALAVLCMACSQVCAASLASYLDSIHILGFVKIWVTCFDIVIFIQLG